MKRKLLILAAAAICLSIAATGTAAFFTAETTAHNTITTGTIRIAIDEKQNVSGEELDYSDPADAVMPGRSLSKIVRVQNTGTGESWVRASVTVEITAADGQTRLPTEFTAGNRTVSMVQLLFNEAARGDWQWVQGPDGFYYYKVPADAEGRTAPLFTNVRFAPETGNEYQNCSVRILINSDAVQSRNNTPESGSVLDVGGWPAHKDPASPLAAIQAVNEPELP